MVYDLRSYLLWNIIRTKIYNYFPNLPLNSLFPLDFRFCEEEISTGWIGMTEAKKMQRVLSTESRLDLPKSSFCLYVWRVKIYDKQPRFSKRLEIHYDESKYVTALCFLLFFARKQKMCYLKISSVIFCCNLTRIYTRLASKVFVASCSHWLLRN